MCSGIFPNTHRELSMIISFYYENDGSMHLVAIFVRLQHYTKFITAVAMNYKNGI